MLPYAEKKTPFFMKKGVAVFLNVLYFILFLSFVSFFILLYFQFWGSPVLEVEETLFVGKIESSQQTKTPDSISFQKLYAAHSENGEVGAWLALSGGAVDAPVLVTQDMEYYQSHGIDGQQALGGALFADNRTPIMERNKLQKNTIIYGKNTNILGGIVQKSSFSSLSQFETFSFAEKNRYLNLTTETDTMMWEIFAVFYADETLLGVKTPMELSQIAKEKSLYEYPSGALENDRTLTLVTNTHNLTGEKKRMVVMAKLSELDEPQDYEALQRKGRDNVKIRTVNLKAGMPDVSFAKNTLNVELRRAKADRIHVMKLIHGWGSTGKGGAIRTAVQKALLQKKQSGQIVDFIKGEDFSAGTISGQGALMKYPELRRDDDFAKDNIGITLVLLY